MTDTPHDAPPPGEEIHLPGPTLLPIITAAGITLTVIGTTIGWIFSILGLIITVWAIVRWIRDTRRDVAALPRRARPLGRQAAEAGTSQLAPSAVQAPTMSRIDRIPAISPLSTTIRWRKPSPDHRGGRLLERPVGRGERQLRGQVVRDVLGVRVLPGPDRDQDVALGDDARAPARPDRARPRRRPAGAPSPQPPHGACVPAPPSVQPRSCPPGRPSRPPRSACCSSSTSLQRLPQS